MPHKRNSMLLLWDVRNDNVRRKSEYSTVDDVIFYLLLGGEKGVMGWSVVRG